MTGFMPLPFEARVDHSQSLTPTESPRLPQNSTSTLPTSLPVLTPSNSQNSITNSESAVQMETAITKSGTPPEHGNATVSGSRSLLSTLKSIAKVGARVLAAPVAIMGFTAAKAVTLLVASFPAFVVGLAVGTFPVWSCMLGMNGDIGDIAEKGIKAGAYFGNKLSEASGSLMSFALNDPKMGAKMAEVSQTGDRVFAVIGGVAGAGLGVGVGVMGTAFGCIGGAALACMS